MAGEVIELTFSANADAHSAGDVVAAPEELVNFAREDGRGVLIQSVVLIDEGDQGAALDLVFLSADGSLGSESAAAGPTDTVAKTILGVVSIEASDYSDMANSQVATKNNVGLLLHPAAASTSVWVGLIARGSIDLAAADDITVKIGRVHA